MSWALSPSQREREFIPETNDKSLNLDMGALEHEAMENTWEKKRTTLIYASNFDELTLISTFTPLTVKNYALSWIISKDYSIMIKLNLDCSKLNFNIFCF